MPKGTVRNNIKNSANMHRNPCQSAVNLQPRFCALPLLYGQLTQLYSLLYCCCMDCNKWCYAYRNACQSHSLGCMLNSPWCSSSSKPTLILGMHAPSPSLKLSSKVCPPSPNELPFIKILNVTSLTLGLRMRLTVKIRSFPHEINGHELIIRWGHLSH